MPTGIKIKPELPLETATVTLRHMNTRERSDGVLPDRESEGIATPSTSQRTGDLSDILPRLQIVDQSTFSKPANYRVSPISAPSTSPAPPSVWEDWSGRGAHVDFAPDEEVPLKQGRFLGQGVMGPVYETEIKGQSFAWKQRFCRQRIGKAERKEIEILKKLSHTHIIQLVGTYTWRQFLGLLLYPVAVCDLHTFFDDVEAVNSAIWSEEGIGLEAAQRERLNALGILGSRDIDFDLFEYYLMSKIGCIVSAVEYLHQEKVRHKDLKPSNILLSRDRLWLTDFGSATDFSLLSVSATENGERGTPKYFAPEVAQYLKSGRSADIFSLGCILLEICVLLDYGKLGVLTSLRPAQDRSFQANLDRIEDWFALLDNSLHGHDHHVAVEIRNMLSKNPQQRPYASEVRARLSLADELLRMQGKCSMFGDCCKLEHISLREHEKQMDSLSRQHDEDVRHLKGQYANLFSQLEAHRTRGHMQLNEISALRVENYDLHQALEVEQVRRIESTNKAWTLNREEKGN